MIQGSISQNLIENGSQQAMVISCNVPRETLYLEPCILDLEPLPQLLGSPYLIELLGSS